jgi:Glycosyltransferase family 87
MEGVPLARALPTTASPPAAAARGRLRGNGLAIALILAGYLLAAVAVTWRLWADPASHTIAGNPNDADFFAWFMRYDATALTHGRLPALVTAAMNAPQGINVMWNTSMLLPGVLLAPVTLLAGPQTSLTVLTTVGFAGSAASLFLVLRRWEVSTGSAALAGAVYGFSPALLQASIGHYNLQFAVLPPLIIDLAVGLCVRSRSPVRDGVLLGLLAAAQLFTGEELLLLTGIAAALLIAVLALGRPRAVPGRCRPAAAGFVVSAAVTLLLAGYGLWVQFFGPLTQHGSSFTPDFFKNDVTGFVTPSKYLLFHTAASAASAASYQGGAPEYLAYLGWPLIAVLAVAAVACWRQPAVRATAVTLAVLALLSLGGHPLVGGTAEPGITLPWHWLESLPVIGTALPNRLSIVADGVAAALLAFSLDQARAWSARARRAPARWAGAMATAAAVAACLPLLPLPLPAATPMPLPVGWSAAFAALRLPENARVLVVPVPTATITAPLRWQADTGEPGSMIGGYFIGPAWNGQAYVEGDGVAATAQYLDWLWGGPPASVPAASQVRADLDGWRPAAVVAVAPPDSALGQYLERLFGRPSFEFGSVLAWRR